MQGARHGQHGEIQQRIEKNTEREEGLILCNCHWVNSRASINHGGRA